MGRGNTYIGTGFGHSRKASMTVEVATWNTDVMATQNGSVVETGSTQVTKYEEIEKTSDGKWETQFTALGTAGSEIGHLYVVGNDGSYIKEYTQAGVASTGKFAYSSSTKEITFFSGEEPAADVKLALAYTFKTANNAQRIAINSDGIPPTVLVTAYGLARDTCTGEQFEAVIEGTAQVDGNWSFELTADGEPAVQNLSMEFVKTCTSKQLYSFTIYTDDEAV